MPTSASTSSARFRTPDNSARNCDLAVVIADLGPGGAQRVAVTLVDALSQRGYRACLVTLASPADDHFVPQAPVERIALGLQAPSRTFVGALVANARRLLALRRAVRASGAPTVLALVGVTNILTVVACAGLKVRVVISERNDPERQSLGSPWNLLRRALYRFADVVTANSASALRTMAAYVPAPRLMLVANPFVPLTVERKPVSSGLRILNVGRLSRQKAQDVLLQAFARVAPMRPAWRLAIIGTGEVAAPLQALARQLGVAPQVDWIPVTQDIGSEYQSAQIFVLPSRHEGMPNALLEAMACGLPPIVSEGAGGGLDLVVHDRTGLVVPVEDVDALAAALCRLMDDESLRTRLGAAAQQEIRRRSGPDMLADWEAALALPHRSA